MVVVTAVGSTGGGPVVVALALHLLSVLCFMVWCGVVGGFQVTGYWLLVAAEDHILIFDSKIDIDGFQASFKISPALLSIRDCVTASRLRHLTSFAPADARLFMDSVHTSFQCTAASSGVKDLAPGMVLKHAELLSKFPLHGDGGDDDASANEDLSTSAGALCKHLRLLISNFER